MCSSDLSVKGLSVPAPLLDLARMIASEYVCSLPVALSPAIPPGVKDRLVTAWTLVPEAISDDPLTPLQQEVVRTLRDLGGSLVEQKTKPLPASSMRAMRLLRNKGIVRQTQRIQPFAERKKSETMLRLTADADRIEAFLRGDGRRRQIGRAHV